jgi:hypothetical protein
MPTKCSGGEFPLPRFEQEQGNCARSMNGKAADPGINPGIASLPAVRVARMGAQGADSLDNRGKPA